MPLAGARARGRGGSRRGHDGRSADGRCARSKGSGGVQPGAALAGPIERPNRRPTWTGPRENDRNIGWSRALLAAVRPFTRGGSYLNFPGLGEEHDALLREAHGDNYERLVALKTKYDPSNLFRMNLNIQPARSASAPR